MRNSIHCIVVSVLILGLCLVSSCNKEVFNVNDYERIVDFASPIDSIDAQHTWNLFSIRQLSVTANAGSGAVRAYVLSSNPLTDSNSEILAQVPISDGETKSLSVSIPLDETGLYAALLDDAGTYTITQIPDGSSSFDFSSPLAVKQGLTTLPKLQRFTYCFEEEMPVPGDYDYNDIILRVSQEPVNERQIQLHVELSAVGGMKQLGAGIRLLDYQFLQIDSVTTENGELFSLGGSNYDQPAPTGILHIWKSTELLQEGLHQEPVIYLFDDAHWAMGDNITVQNSDFTRKKYNVTKNSSTSAELLPERIITYNIYFKEGVKTDNFSLGSLDVFMLESYNGSYWEVHSYEHRSAQATYEYTLPNTSKMHLPWGLVIPYSYFRYPLEGNNIGFMKDGTSFGSYLTKGHSFGEWAMDASQYHDWYLYPAQNQVY